MNNINDAVEIEIFDTHNNFLGDSPILPEEIVEIEWEDVLNELGAFRFRLFAHDEHRDLVMDTRNHLEFYAYVYDPETDNVERRHVYDGKITNPGIIISEEGVPYIEVNGLSIGAELSDIVCHINFLRQEYPYVAPAYVINNYKDRYLGEREWALDPDGEQETTYDVGTLAASHRISYFEFLNDISDYTRSCFCVKPGRLIRWLNQDYPDSGLHACYLDYYDKDDLPLDTLPIKSLSLEQVSNTAVSSVYAYGNSGYQEWLDPSWDPGAPWRVRQLWGATVLENLDTMNTYGEIQVRKDFAQAGSQDALKRCAMNYLLNNNSPQHKYGLEVANLTPGSLFPGDMLRVDFDGVDSSGKYLSIHDDLVCISVSHTIDPDTKLYTGTIELSEKVTRIIENGDIIQQLTSRLTDANATG